MRAVFDAGPLIHLSWIDQLQLLHVVFDRVLIPSVVRDEVLRPNDDIRGIAAVRNLFASEMIEVRNLSDAAVAEGLVGFLDRGEAAAIALMREVSADILVLDDGRARYEALRQGIPITGTIGILRRARDREVLPAVTPYLIQLRQYGFWISDAVFNQIQAEESAIG